MSDRMEIRAPAEQTEGTRSQVLRWLKAVGQDVTENEPLIEIETDKVTVEVAAPASGVLREILKNEQDEIAPGEVLGLLELARSELAEPQGVSTAVAPAPGRGVTASSAPSARGTRGTASDAGERRAESVTPSAADTRPASLSPAVRRLIAERGLDASTIRGSGEGGRITIDDVLAHGAGTDARQDASPIAARSGGTQAPTHQPASHPRPATALPATEAARPGRIVPHSAIRKRIADHMVQSLLQTAPHVTTVFEADMTAVIAHRARHKADFEERGAPLTFTAYFLAATVQAIRAVPEANSRWTDSALEIYDAVNIGVATALEDRGLVVPVLRAVESKTLFEIARGLNELVAAARAGKLQPADVRGGTFTISNHGVSGSLLAAPIVINQPQSAILGVGKLEKRATVVEQEGREAVIVRPKCYVTLTIDHRVMDGHQANRFLQTFVRALETWPAQ
jgi:2-oxoglutarate dehydrogenase E2 component (dihydrolipoamide succinyltransferase)